MSAKNQRTYEFGPFRLNPSEGQLLRNGESVTLTPKAFEALVFLIERRGHLIEKEELMRALWPDTFVEEANLAHHVWRLRKVLEENKDGERYIETVPKRGYRFVAPIREVEQGPDLVVEQHTITRLVAERETESDTSLAVGYPSQVITARKSVGVDSRFVLLSVVAVLILGVTTFAYLKLRNSTRVAASAPVGSPITSLAVLPFKPLTSDSSDPSLEVGMADALITRLSNLKELTVRPTSAVMKYSSPTEDLARVGKELRVESVLDGRVQRSGDRIRVTVQLIRSEDGKPLWAERFDEKFTDIFSLEDSLSAKVTQALALRLNGTDASKLSQHYTANIEAYESYLKGRFQMNMAAEGALKAVASYQQAIEKDPRFPLAYAGLADAYSTLGFMGLGAKTPGEQFNKAKAEALKALELDSSLAEAHSALANVLFSYDWNWTEAEKEFKRAIELNPNLAEARHGYSEYLQAMARFDEALVEIKRAQELDPLSVNINFHYGLCLFAMGRDDEALEQYRKTLDIDSTTGASGSHWGIAVIYEKRRMYDEAIRELEEAQRLDPRPSWRLVNLAEAYALRGDRDKATRMLNDLLKMRTQQFVSPTSIARIYVALGDKDQAFKWFEIAYSERETVLTFLKVVNLGELRSDERYQSLLRRMNLDN